jgi:hypothetical protein
MKIFWRNEALCMRPENDTERKSLAAICEAFPQPQNNIPAFTGHQNCLEVVGVKHQIEP